MTRRVIGWILSEWPLSAAAVCLVVGLALMAVARQPDAPAAPRFEDCAAERLGLDPDELVGADLEVDLLLTYPQARELFAACTTYR